MSGRTGEAADGGMTGGIGGTWMHFWFEPADARPLAVVRILASLLGLILWWSYWDDLQAWFGPQGVLPVDVVEQWRPRSGLSLYDRATTAASLRAAFGITGLALVLTLLGACTPVASIAAAILWASLQNRGPMLAGPADDCLAVLLWCLAGSPTAGIGRRRDPRRGAASPCRS
ncbi:MAG: hypothetical protein EBZ59_08210 [Planctomycetia bacterium]|nr:hypothetical protein [Planctomycetia bacterium]